MLVNVIIGGSKGDTTGGRKGVILMSTEVMGECEFPLVFTDKGKYKWQGDFAALQKFTEEVLKMKGK
jgi:hypothetical protein